MNREFSRGRYIQGAHNPVCTTGHSKPKQDCVSARTSAECRNSHMAKCQKQIRVLYHVASCNNVGTGHLWEDSIGGTTSSYTISGATMTITLSALGSHTKRRHQFELQQVPPAVSLSPCGAERTEVDVSSSSYDGRNLVQKVFVTVRSISFLTATFHDVLRPCGSGRDYTLYAFKASQPDASRACQLDLKSIIFLFLHSKRLLHLTIVWCWLGLFSAQAHATTVCVEVRFAAPLDDQRVASLRAVPFKQIRQRLYILKQKFDDEHPQPSVPLMPLVETTNLATTMYEPPMMLAAGWVASFVHGVLACKPHTCCVNRVARCQINASADTTQPWTDALASFGSRASAAITAIAPTKSKFTLPCPVRISRLVPFVYFVSRAETLCLNILSACCCFGCVSSQTGEVCDDLAVLSKAWVCEAARDIFAVEACNAGNK